jgi:crotonobetainyl-CoA:carnitine CoA-transferase CaiB-like acyl-CoA transferase
MLARWAADRPAEEACALLAARGVPAAVCNDARTIDTHEQYEARGLFTELEHPRLGCHHVPGLPYRFASNPGWVRSPAPTFGQHNAEVLRSVSGLDDDAVADLVASGVISDRPRGL